LTVELFDRARMRYLSLAERANKVELPGGCVDPASDPVPISPELGERTAGIAREMIGARGKGRSVILAFGAHAIKNGLGRTLGELARRGWVSHLATNGAGVIHDWELAFQGATSEDVRANVREGRFGTWEETGLYINLALAVGAWRGLGYGESVGSMIAGQGLEIPSRGELRETIAAPLDGAGAGLRHRAAACDLLELLDERSIASGRLAIEHRFPEYSAQAIAWSLGLPFTSHPMFGHDIIYTHAASRGAALGRAAEVDFLSFVNSVSRLEGGVYLSIGSAVMSPMIFEKALSMARNVSLQGGEDIRDCRIHVVDLQEATWDWSRGEPPTDDPAYYLRFMKTFNRMDCLADYACADNRAFLVSLYRALSALEG
jgi:hypothetical protein